MPKHPIEYKPIEIPTVHPRWTPVKIAFLIMYLAAIAVVLFDVFVWRP